MASLDKQQTDYYRHLLLERLSEGYFLAGVNDGGPTDGLERFNGALGVLDWYLHGQVSELWQKKRIDANSPALFSTGNQFRAIVLPWSIAAQGKKISETIAGLQHCRLLILESTFPKDILEKLTQNLKKESVHCELIPPPPV